MLSFTSHLVDLKSTVWNLGFITPSTIAKQFLSINDKRVVCILNGKVKIHAALMPKGSATWFVTLNNEVIQKLQLKKGDPITIEMKTDSSQYGMETPQEFIELLQQESSGRKYFEQLTMGKQRALLQLIIKLKSSQKRIEKSIIILDYLKQVKGNLNFKELHVAFKNSRF